MKIKNYKRKCTRISCILILAGILISAAGFGISGFDYRKLQDYNEKDPWYQTVHIKEDQVWYDVDLGNNIHLMNIGSAK